MPCRHLRPSSGLEHIYSHITSSVQDDDYLMNEYRGTYHRDTIPYSFQQVAQTRLDRPIHGPLRKSCKVVSYRS